jgi:hypothetical protein
MISPERDKVADWLLLYNSRGERVAYGYVRVVFVLY